MLKADFFTRFGLYVRKDFLDADLCAKLRSEAHAAPGGRAKAKIVDLDNTPVLDESTRRTAIVAVSASSVSLVQEQLLALKPTLENHFRLTLTGCTEPHFLIYREGDFYKPHLDRDPDSNVDHAITKRRVSVVIFLNDQTENPERGCYCGGSLTFYGLIDDPRWQTYGFPLFGETGLLIAFSPDVVHEVLPVTYGERHTIVSWLF
jgi:predicted 2-oxoglutarate/Fe(II)-dependent dioxygenase YbiX